MTVTKCYAALETLVKDAADAAIAAEMRELGFDGDVDQGFTGYTTLWKDAGLPQEEVHISYPDARVTMLYGGGGDITPPPDGCGSTRPRSSSAGPSGST